MPQWLTQEEVTLIQSSKNKPDFLINRMALDLQQSMNEKRIDPCLAANIDTTLSAITAAAAACERIKIRPFLFLTHCCCTGLPISTVFCCLSDW
jgi:putative membrane protein